MPSSQGKTTTWMAKFCVLRKNVNWWLKIFKIYISNFTLCSIFSFEIVFMEWNKIKDLVMSKDLWVKYQFIFKSTLSSCHRRSYSKSLMHVLIELPRYGKWWNTTRGNERKLISICECFKAGVDGLCHQLHKIICYKTD